jgi:hypothetical protein
MDNNTLQNNKKTIVTYQEKYKKGNMINKKEMLRLITENIDKITIEMRERTTYSDKTEEIVISVRY